jgi:hypothetical protein
MSIRYKIKYRILRGLVIWKNWRQSIDNKMEAERSKISPYEEKAIRLWKMLLKDEDTKMSYNSFGVRQIEKENIFMIFQHSGNNDYIMTLMDVNENGRSLYEFHIPPKDSDDVCEYFDLEMEKRMRKVENNKRNIIESDIDKLLEQEEEVDPAWPHIQGIYEFFL